MTTMKEKSKKIKYTGEWKCTHTTGWNWFSNKAEAIRHMKEIAEGNRTSVTDRLDILLYTAYESHVLVYAASMAPYSRRWKPWPQEEIDRENLINGK